MATRKIAKIHPTQVARKAIERAKEKAREKAAGNGRPNKEVEPAVAMAWAYEAVRSEYEYTPATKHVWKLNPDSVYARWYETAAQIADKLGADYETFVRAQFYWIHQWFGRACEIYELKGGSKNRSAERRYRNYMKLVDSGDDVALVGAKAFEAPKPKKADVDKINEQRLKQLMHLWELSEEDALIAFVEEGIFDDQWLEQNEVYQKLKREGRV